MLNIWTESSGEDELAISHYPQAVTNPVRPIACMLYVEIGWWPLSPTASLAIGQSFVVEQPATVRNCAGLHVGDGEAQVNPVGSQLFSSVPEFLPLELLERGPLQLQ
jgi:hypothetical protein